MNKGRLAWLGRLGKLIIALAMIAAISGKDLTLNIELSWLTINLELQKP